MPKKKKPFFSVIIPAYNRKEMLKVAIESVLAQDFTDFELIVVDDGSTDGTKEMVKSKFGNKISYIYQKNRGPAAARNTGIKNSEGKFICFLDSDDRFRREKLSQAYLYIKKYPQYAIFHTQEVWYRRGKFLEHKKKHQKPEGNVFTAALKICCVSISTAIIKREVFTKVGLFDESFPLCEDYEFWLRASAVYPIKLIPKVLTIKEGGRTDELSQKKGLDKYRALAIKKLLAESRLKPQQKKLAQAELQKKTAIYLKGAEKRGKKEEIHKFSKLVKT